MAALIAVVVIAFSYRLFLLFLPPATVTPTDSTSGVTISRAEVKADADPPEHAQMMYSAPPLIPVELKTERHGSNFTINLMAHGEIFDFEKYVSTDDSYSVSQAAGEDYVPPIPVLQFPLSVGGTPWTWKGNLFSELEAQPSHATITVSTDKVTIGQSAVSTIRSDVLVVIEPHGTMPGATRRMTFWFQEGHGLIKRQFGPTSMREPRG